MGLAQSCLGVPKTVICKARNKAAVNGASNRLQLESGVSDVNDSPVCKERDPAVLVIKPINKQNVPASVAVGSVGDAVLKLEPLSYVLTETVTTSSLQSAFTSSDGYPHSSWDLGPPSTDDEQSRVQSLRALDILDSVSHGRRLRIDEEADIILGALMRMFNAITAMLVLFDDTRIIIRNAKGVLKPGEFPYRWSFCAYTLTKARPQTLIIPDATKDIRFSENPFVRGEPSVRFYCGAPLVSASGHIFGTVCFADNKSRPDFDVSQCYIVNNMAELLVRHIERYCPNAGPTGRIDPETTALARVARTMECYDAVTGLVDISLPEGWMLMYVNEAWETVCSPWTRKQLVGRLLQRVLLLEEEPNEEIKQPATQEPLSSTDATTVPSPAAKVAARNGEEKLCLSNEANVRTSPKMLGLSLGQSMSIGTGLEGMPEQTCSSIRGACHASQNSNAISSSGGNVQGIMLRGDGVNDLKLMAMPGEQRLQCLQQHNRRPTSWHEAWDRWEQELRAGKEVELGRARVLLEDGQPSTMVVRVSARSANCHVLDAAVRMPVGVPHHEGLPASILAVEVKPTVLSPGHSGAINSSVDKAQNGATPAEGTIEATEARSEPHYCIITLSRIGADVDVNEDKDECQPRYLVPMEALPEATYDGSVSKGGSGAAPASPRAHTDLSPPATRPVPGLPAITFCGRPSLDSAVHVSASHRSRNLIPVGASFRGSTRSCASQGLSGWTYGMEPFPGLKLGHLLGKGGYGKVFAASYKGQKVAAKVISNEMVKSATCVNGVTLEALLTQEVEHPYIVRTYKCVVRSYGPCEQHSMAGVGARSSAHGGSSYRMPSMRGGGTPCRSMVPSPMPSAASTLPTGLGNGIDSTCGVSRLGRPSETEPPAVAMDPRTRSHSVSPVMDGSAAPSAHTPLKAVTAAAPSACDVASLMSPSASRQTSATMPESAAAQVVPQEDDFDSFDDCSDKVAGGMIDQLVSGGAPVYVPKPATAQAVPLSVAGDLQQQPCTVKPESESVTATSTVIPTTQGSMSTLKTKVDPMAAALTVTGQVPPSVISPADLFSPGNGPAEVFSTRAVAAAAGHGADAAFQNTGLPQIDSLQDGETWILQEYCGCGTLQDAIDTGRLRTEPSRLRGKPHMLHILLTAQEIASAMACVHSRGYMHGDLSAVNILLTDDPGGSEAGSAGRGWIAKVADFGLAKHLPDRNQPHVSSSYGVITHCAPEVLKSHMQTQNADCYSFGVLLWQMFTGSRPWANMNRFQIFGTMTSATSPGLRFLPTQLPPPRYNDLTMRCLSYDHASRPTFAEICEELRLITYESIATGEIAV
ncbi:hypothetical protein VaNZ11_014877 [Volvox africanus]|uniref:Protein kinase domain-containing protein n=1 Tax=Volvox africanus TaxID=51714 RepID=A0ABQ5SJD8_9CHLO|nr:hypothetical protein VaNZ11_014877 [Volvox africanus]